MSKKIENDKLVKIRTGESNGKWLLKGQRSTELDKEIDSEIDA